MRKKMIKKESGIKDVNKSFTSMTKAKYSSPVIDYYRKQKESYAQVKKNNSLPLADCRVIEIRE